VSIRKLSIVRHCYLVVRQGESSLVSVLVLHWDSHLARLLGLNVIRSHFAQPPMAYFGLSLGGLAVTVEE
jgi:hypothetical protein